MLDPIGSGSTKSTSGASPKTNLPGTGGVRGPDGRHPRIPFGANVASSADRSENNATDTFSAKNTPGSVLPRRKVATQPPPRLHPKADKGSGPVADLLAQMLGGRAECAKKVGTKGSGGAGARQPGTSGVGGGEIGDLPKRGTALLGVRKKAVVIAHGRPGSSAGDSASGERSSGSGTSSALGRHRIGVKRLKADARASASSTRDDAGIAGPPSRRTGTPTKKSSDDSATTPTRSPKHSSFPLEIPRKLGSLSERRSNRGSGSCPPGGGGYRALAMMSTAQGPVNEPAGARAERRRTPPLVLEPSRARVSMVSPFRFVLSSGR